MVKGIRLQKPSPKALAVSVAGAPMASAATVTISTASAAKTQESGNQRSAQLEQAMAKRAERLSCKAVPGVCTWEFIMVYLIVLVMAQFG